MILHCVFCERRDGVGDDEIFDLFQELKNFADALPGVLSFDFGPNRDFEAKSQQFKDGFVIAFSDEAALMAYADHPRHKDLGRHLCDLCRGGASGIMVFDIETAGAKLQQ